MDGRRIIIGEKVLEMRDGVFEKVESKEPKVVRFTDRANADYSLSAPPVKRGLFYSLYIIIKWVCAFFAYPFVIFVAALGISIVGMLQCIASMIKDVKNHLS